MKCIECGLENYHRMDCGSKIIMMDYEAFVSRVEYLPEALLLDLLTRCNVEKNKRDRYINEYAESIPSLFDMYVRKED